MFVLCLLYSKDKRQSKGKQDKKVQMKYKERKKIPAGEIFSAPVQTGPGAHPISYTMGTVSFSWV